MGISRFRKKITVKFPLREVDPKVHDGRVRITFRGIYWKEGPIVAVNLTVLCTLLRKMRRELRLRMAGKRARKSSRKHFSHSGWVGNPGANLVFQRKAIKMLA